MLHTLVLALAFWFAVWTLLLLPLYPNAAAKAPGVIVAELGPFVALILLRIGRLREASLAYLAGTWIFATMVVVRDGGVRSPAQVFYATLPVLAIWLLGYRAALWTAGVCMASTFVFALLEMTGVRLSRPAPATPLGIWAVLLQVILIGTVPIAQILRRLQDTLGRSRRAEAELRQYKQHLEGLVEERTAELVRARDEALAANRSKGVFLAKMSHELRTPLNAILGFSGLVLKDASLPERHRKDLGIVGRSGEHLLGLIDDVLDMAKIDTGAAAVYCTSFDLHSLVDDSVDMLREGALAKNLHLATAISPRTPRFVRSDPGKLRQILTNLIGNALKYTEKGGVDVRVDSKNEGGRWILVLEVEDTGVGISPADQARIFDPFVQAGGGPHIKGVGLGLSISRQFVQLLGGSITLESAVGRGSRFRVDLPVEIADSSETAPESTATHYEVEGLEPGQPDTRILIVEDQHENSMLLERILSSAGFQVRVAENGIQAIEAFKSWRPHFICMDLRLPVMDGMKATRRIRDLEGGTGVKIAAITASAFASERDAVLAAGFDDFLSKPYRPREIFECLAKHLGVRYRFRAEPPRAEPLGAATPVPAKLAALPEDLLDDLQKAVTSLDCDRIARVIQRVSQEDPTAAGALSRLAERLSFTSILHAIESSRGERRGAMQSTAVHPQAAIEERSPG